MASCWICLEEGPDTSGQPLRRDCSCRGNHAGYAHLSCLVQFAESKCKEIFKYKTYMFHKQWGTCEQCKQPYQNGLALDLSDECVSFAENAYGYKENNFNEKLKMMEAIHFRIESVLSNAVDASLTTLEDEVQRVVKLHSMVEQVINSYNMKSWVHMPKSSYEFQWYKRLRVHFEADGYAFMGSLLRHCCDKKETYNEEITGRIGKCYRKALTIFNLFDEESSACIVEGMIYSFNYEVLGLDEEDPKIILPRLRRLYEEFIQDEGSDSQAMIIRGLTLGAALAEYNYTIEGERLVTKLTASCCRINGHKHKLTKSAQELLGSLRKRVVAMPKYKPSDIFIEFEALSYEQDGQIIILKGPISYPRNLEKEKRIATLSSSVMPLVGCPVACHGLENEQSELNGKIGDLRSLPTFEDGAIRYTVHFEDKNLKSACVELKNLRIAFELPSKE